MTGMKAPFAGLSCFWSASLGAGPDAACAGLQRAAGERSGSDTLAEFVDPQNAGGTHPDVPTRTEPEQQHRALEPRTVNPPQDIIHAAMNVKGTFQRVNPRCRPTPGTSLSRAPAQLPQFLRGSPQCLGRLHRATRRLQRNVCLVVDCVQASLQVVNAHDGLLSRVEVEDSHSRPQAPLRIPKVA
jgi:hypothetical protein